MYVCVCMCVCVRAVDVVYEWCATVHTVRAT